jgi:hypothetical protein
MNKILLIIFVAVFLTGCTALMGALSALGGGSATKGHGNDNTVLVGSDQSNGLSTGGKTDIDAENVGRDVTGRDKNSTSVLGAELVNIINYPNMFVYWLMGLMLLGWLLPTPTRMFKGFIGLFRRKK